MFRIPARCAAGLLVACSAAPRLTYPKVRCAPVLEITIFATACRFLIQTL
jgi:hypothetical protein